MPKKPKLLILGETHLPEREEVKELALKTIDTQNGKKIHPDMEVDKDKNKEILRKMAALIQTGANKLTNVTQLFIEAPATTGRQTAYSQYKETRELSQLKTGIWLEMENERIHGIDCAKAFLSKKASNQSGYQNIIRALDSNKNGGGILPLFAFYREDMAHKAGICDIKAVDNEKYSFLAGAANQIEDAAISAYFFEESDDFTGNDLKYFRKLALSLFDSIKEPREKGMYEHVKIDLESNHAQSALMCGANHAKKMYKLLSKDKIISGNFEVQVPDFSLKQPEKKLVLLKKFWQSVTGR